MLLEVTPRVGKRHHYQIRSKSEREYEAARATALNADLHPELAEGWNGLLRVNGSLYINDSPEARQRLAPYFKIAGDGQ